MNRAVVWITWRQRLASPLRLLLFVVTCALPVCFARTMGEAGLRDPGVAFQLVLIFGAGVIGQDVSSGVLQLYFVRPLTRSSYVLSRWFAIGLLAAGLSWVLLAASCAVRMEVPPIADLGLFVLERGLLAFGFAAVLVLASSLVAGLGDLAVLAAGGMIAALSHLVRSRLVRRVGEEIGDFLVPSLRWTDATAGAPTAFDLVSYASTVSLCLALSIVVVNRKELSYANR